MKVGELFARKSPSPRKRVGETQLEAAQLAEFRETFSPVAAKAKQYLVAPCINGKQRMWLLPTEDFDDLPPDKIAYVLKYKQWFLDEINKVVLDEIPYEFPTSTNNEAQNNSNQQAAGVGAADCSGSCSR